MKFHAKQDLFKILSIQSTAVHFIPKKLKKLQDNYLATFLVIIRSMKKRSWFLSILAAILPALLTVIILGDIFQVNIANFLPRIWNDQVGYWHWAKSFSTAGFNAGYNGWDELTAPAAFNPYGENGPFYQMIYGSIGWLVGWKNALPIYINMGFLTFSLLLFIRKAELENEQILHLGTSVLLLFPILLYLPLSSHETLNQSIAILLTTVFYFTQKRDLQSYQKILFALFLFFASLIRLSWAVLFLPFFFITVRGSFTKKLLLSLTISAFLGYTSLAISGYLLPPSGNIILELIKETRTSGAHILLSHIKFQLATLFSPQHRMDLIITLETFSLGLWSFFYFLRKKTPLDERVESTSFLNAYNLLVPLGMGIVFYLVAGFHRIFVPHLLITALLLIKQRKYLPLYLSLFIGVLFYSPFWSAYQKTPINYQPMTAEFLATKNIIKQNIVFDPNSESHWCNTLLLPIDRYNDYVPMLPAGIGASPIIAPQNLSYPPKSKYILLDHETLTRGAYLKYFPMDDLNLDLLDSLPHAEIYYNADSGCSRE